MKVPIGTLVLVTWLDAAHSEVGWLDDDRVAQFSKSITEMECQSVGWLVGRRDGIVVLRSSKAEGEGEHTMGVMKIPAGSVKAVEVLRVKGSK